MLHRILSFVCLLACLLSPVAAIDLPLPVSNLERAEPVSFSKEILPLLQRSCLACHHAKEPEGHLILESHTLLLKGGETGPGIIAGKSAESLLFARATGQVEPLMPPEDNKVGAKSLSADELGLLKRWIDEGAKADAPIAAPKLVWQALPETYRPVYAIALSPDDQYAVYGQGNRAKILHLPTWTNVGQLIDPSLNSGSISGLAHLDIVQSVAFSPDGSRIATGGYKSAKIWKRVLTSEKLTGSPVTSATSAVSMSLDGSRYALVAGENIELWDRLTNQKQIAIKHELPEVSKLQWSADNQWIAAQGNDGRVRVWQIDTQQPVADQAALPLLQSMLLSATGKWLVGINPELKLSVWTFDVHADMPTPMMLTEKKHEPWQAFVGINALAVLPMDAPRIVFASEDGKAMIADPTSGAIDRTIDHGSPIKSLTISQDRLRLATGAVNGTIKVWAIASGEQQLFLERDALTNLAMAAATGNVNRQTANIQRLTNKVGELEKAITKETEAITKAEETRKKAEEEVAVKAKEVEAAKKLMTDHEQLIKDAEVVKQQAEKAVEEQAKKVEALVAQRDPKQKAIEQALMNETKSKDELQKQDQALAAVRDAEKRARQAVVDQQTSVKTEQENLVKLQELATQVKPTAEFTTVVTRLAFAPDNQTLVALRDQQFWIHRDAGKSIEPRLPFNATPVNTLTVTAEQQIIAIQKGSEPAAWPLQPRWELATTIGTPETDVLSDRVSMLKFSPDGRELLVGSGPPSRFGDLKSFSVAEGKLLRDFGEIHSDTIFAAEYSPDGRTIVTCGADKTVRTFNAQSGERIRNFEGHTHHVLGVAWRDDCQTIASAGADQSVKVWDAETGETRRTITGFPKEVTAISFVGASSQIVTAGSEGQARLYDANDGRHVRSFSGPKDSLFAIGVTHDGKTIIAGGQEGIVFLWELESGKLVQQTQ